MSHVRTIAELDETERKLKNGKIMTMAKQKMGTPPFVHLRRNLGARPSIARP